MLSARVRKSSLKFQLKEVLRILKSYLSFITFIRGWVGNKPKFSEFDFYIEERLPLRKFFGGELSGSRGNRGR